MVFGPPRGRASSCRARKLVSLKKLGVLFFGGPMSRQVVVASLGGAAALILAQRWRRALRGSPPTWFTELLTSGELERLAVPEWDNSSLWRRLHGWLGTDYAHGPDAAVHIAGYGLSGSGVGARLVGAVHFGRGAESHQATGPMPDASLRKLRVSVLTHSIFSC